ncbi:MAG: YerC/YecD family TrpR-related protein [Patescibacteria group bacterium]
MSKPREEIQNEEYFREIHFLYEIVNSLKNTEEIKKFLKDILTKSELRMIKRRWHIATLLVKGLDLRTIASKTKTSTQTVSRIKRIIEEGEGGITLALEKMGKQIDKEGKDFLKSKSIGGSKFVKNWFK